MHVFMACGHTRKGRFVLWLLFVAVAYLFRPGLLKQERDCPTSRPVPSDKTHRPRVPTSGPRSTSMWPPQASQTSRAHKQAGDALYDGGFVLLQTVYGSTCHQNNVGRRQGPSPARISTILPRQIIRNRLWHRLLVQKLDARPNPPLLARLGVGLPLLRPQ